MTKQRLDRAVEMRGLVTTRSQAESYIRLGKVKVNGQIVTKAGAAVSDSDRVDLLVTEQYVSRAGLKLESVAKQMKLDFRAKTVLDVGSSTGGFTQYSLLRGAKRVVAIEVGTNQMDQKLRLDSRIELHEKTDILHISKLSEIPDIVLMDVSFVSVRSLLPHVIGLCGNETQYVIMLKPQFEAVHQNFKHKGIIKNEKMRREILKDFENWSKNYFVILDKADSDVKGQGGNIERFYLLRSTKN